MSGRSTSVARPTVLEQLSPAERVAFVRHDVFPVPFGQVAELTGRCGPSTPSISMVRPVS